MTGETQGTTYIKPLYPVLLGSHFDRGDIGRNDEPEAERVVSCAVSIYKNYDSDLTLAECEFVAGERIKSADEKQETAFLHEVSATYVVAIRVQGSYPSDDELKEVFSDVARTTAWPLFRAYFALLGSQANAELPLLPTDPEMKTSFDEEEGG
jgi:hypothetical protein